MNAQRITFVSHTSKPGGGELALRRYLEATELPVRLVTLEAGGVWATLPAGVDVVHVTGLLGLKRALGGGGLVVANSMRAAFLTALAAPRHTHLVYWVRDGLTDSAMSPLALALTKYVTARKVRHYVANSRWTAGSVREALGIEPERIDVVYSMCGVTDEMLDRPPRSEPHTPLRLLFLGRISPWKAPDVAVRALPLLRKQGVEATLTIAGGVLFGEDNYATELRELLEEEPAATMIGHVEDVAELLESHDIVVHCSALPEPFGQVIVQGLAAGVPVVATHAGGPSEILGGCEGAVFEAGDASALAAALVRVLSNYAVRSARALTKARVFRDGSTAHSTDRVLQELQQRLHRST